MPTTRGQQIDKGIAKYEEIVGDLMRFYEDGLGDVVRGSPDNDELKAEVQVAYLLTMSYAARSVVALKDLKIAHDKEVIDNLNHLLKKADPNYKPLEEVYAEQEAEEAEDDDDDMDQDE